MRNLTDPDLVMGPGSHTLTPEQMVRDASRAMELYEALVNRHARTKTQLETDLATLRAHLVAGEKLMSRCADDSEREALACMLGGHRKRIVEVEQALANLNPPEYILP